jgi:dihydrofolate reductase
MRIILVAAVSKDGFIADSNNTVSSWTSKEDKDFFTKMKEKHSLYVMGSKTYDLLPKPPTGKAKRVVLTSRKKAYKAEVSKNVIFENLTPEGFVEKYENLHDSCLLLGGSKVYFQFLESNLVDEIYLTIEPVILKSGTPLLFNNRKISAYYQPFKHSIQQLNTKGTFLERFILK